MIICMSRFLNSSRENYIREFIKTKLLPNLNKTEFNDIIDCLYKLIEYISSRFCFKPSNYSDYWYQLTENNNRDLIAIFNLLFPFIDDTGGSYKLHHQIYDLSDISTKKSTSDQFLISNIQYNLNIDGNHLYNYSFKDFKCNFYALFETIDRISNKLLTNWINIRPITINNYKESYLYQQSIKFKELDNQTIDLNPDLISDSDPNNVITIQFLDQPHLQIPIYNSYFHYHRNVYDQQNQEIEPNDLIQDSRFFTNVDILNYDTLIQNKGISIGDIFNTLYYDLFYDIIEIKWTIYQGTFEDSRKDELYIKIFNENIAILDIYKNIKWEELPFEKQSEFSNRWLKYLSLVLIKENPNYNHYFHLLKKLILCMEKNYNKMSSIVKLYGYIRASNGNSSLIDDDDRHDKKDSDMETIEFINNVKLIPVEDIYMYLLQAIQQFIVTWYGRCIVKIVGSDISFNYETYSTDSIPRNIIGHGYNFPEPLKVSYKFYYNYAKSFTLSYDDNNTAHKRFNWYYMCHKERNILTGFLNYSYITAKNELYARNSQKEFYEKMPIMSFKRYYVRTYANSNVTIFNVRGVNDYIGYRIFNFIRKHLVDITFESHIYKGLLNEFVVDSRLTDNSFLGTNSREQSYNRHQNLKKYVLNKENKQKDYEKYAYHFLTNKTYNQLDKIKGQTYFDLLITDYRWISFYAMNWVSQISFFHKYINNRVIYITGSTGQGKSTQSPKLFLYGLKMIDRKNDGKVVCSQPRINPVTENSYRISFELGVPIKELAIENRTGKKQDVKTFNPYIQYDTKEDKHIVSDHSGLMLKLVTDRLLYNDLIKNPIFKRLMEKHNSNKSADDIEFNEYQKENLYDIIMVDESHEHNINMDLILTLARDTIKYNNSLKLVIISATMDEDEPIYRKYYKEINDNFSSPYNFYNPQFAIDRSFIDRRIHISPPGQTTQYNVTETYLDYDPATYIDAEKEAFQKVIQLANDEDTDGDILLFSLSSVDIVNLCKKINSKLSSSSKFICLPFYRELPAKWKIFNDLRKNLKKITTNREDVIDEIQSIPNKIIRKVPTETYKRVIIIATNIAEASITIDSLKYVIDIGYFINVSDDHITEETLIESKKISESSRLQRKGRVGRVANGHVYYMYTKGSRENIRSEQKICTENITFNLFELSANRKDDEQIISDANWVTIIYGNVNEKDYRDAIKKSKTMEKNGLVENLIEQHYVYLNSILPCILNLVTSNENIYTIKNIHNELFKYRFDIDRTIAYISKRRIRKLTGYSIDDLYDIRGEFYIVHPSEKEFIRNYLTGAIESVKENVKSSEFILSYRIHSYLSRCIKMGLLINKRHSYIHKSIFENQKHTDFSEIASFFDFEKSIISRILINISNKLNNLHDQNFLTNWYFMNTLLYSYICDLDNIVLIMISLLYITNFNIDKLKFYSIIYNRSNESNDLYIYYLIAKELEKILKIPNKNLSDITYEFEHDKELYLKQKINININTEQKWYLDIDFLLYDQFNLLDNQNKLNLKRNISDYLDNKQSSIDKLIKEITYFLKYDFDILMIKRFVKHYYNNITIFERLINKYDIPNTTNDLLWFKENLSVKTYNDEWLNIKNGFIYGFGTYQTGIYDFDNAKCLNINNIIEQYNFNKFTLSPKSELFVYLYKEKKEFFIIINCDIDSLGYNNHLNWLPIDTQSINITNIKQKILRKLIKIFDQLQSSKGKYLSHLHRYIKYNDTFQKKTKKKKKKIGYQEENYEDEDEDDVENFFKYGLFGDSNNLIPHIIESWNLTTRSNLYA